MDTHCLDYIDPTYIDSFDKLHKYEARMIVDRIQNKLLGIIAGTNLTREQLADILKVLWEERELI